jgi:hypothetical protein
MSAELLRKRREDGHVPITPPFRMRQVDLRRVEVEA